MKILVRKTLLTRLEQSIGVNLWRNLYAAVDGETKDILDNGNLSCAIFVGGMLLSLTDGLLKSPHAGVDGLEKDLRDSGWQEVPFIPGEETAALVGREGALLLWEARRGNDGKAHRHIGFYVGEERAISNDSRETLTPQKHHFKYELEGPKYGPRQIEKIYWHSKLDT